jgi:hypothetical protein
VDSTFSRATTAPREQDKPTFTYNTTATTHSAKTLQRIEHVVNVGFGMTRRDLQAYLLVTLAQSGTDHELSLTIVVCP